MLAPADFFELDGYAHKALFFDTRLEYVWDVLRLLREYLDHLIVPQVRGQVMEGAYPVSYTHLTLPTTPYV